MRIELFQADPACAHKKPPVGGGRAAGIPRMRHIRPPLVSLKTDRSSNNQRLAEKEGIELRLDPSVYIESKTAPAAASGFLPPRPQL